MTNLRTILVTGGAGFIGSAVVRYLVGEVGVRVANVDKLTYAGKLVYVLQGAVFDVAVDVRRGSPHFGRWLGVTLSGENKHQLYVPAGFAHGFCVISETALFAYKCTDVYFPQGEASILWNDPAIGIAWPIAEPVLAQKDRAGYPLAAAPERYLIPYGGQR